MSIARALLPASVHVFVRDWLSANNVLLKGRDGHVLVDSGYSRHAPLTLELLDSAAGLRGTSLTLLANTHCHSDHMGGNAAIAARHGCPIAVPAGEAPLVTAWDTQALLLEYAGQHADRFTVQEVLCAGETRTWGGLDWQLLAAPGHDMRALVFYNGAHGILISGDALWANGFGFVMPVEIEPAALPATRATLDLIASLDVKVVVPGHGEPFSDVGTALDSAYRRLAAFEADPSRLPHHALKVILAFLLLDRQRLAVDALPTLVESVGIFHDFNARFLRMAPAALARSLTHDLVRAGAAVFEDGWIVPVGPARRAMRE
ncbi:MAG: MBL fold metallo-hydrolase [Casimicrobiaceae bacterium]